MGSASPRPRREKCSRRDLRFDLRGGRDAFGVPPQHQQLRDCLPPPRQCPTAPRQGQTRELCRRARPDRCGFSPEPGSTAFHGSSSCAVTLVRSLPRGGLLLNPGKRQRIATAAQGEREPEAAVPRLYRAGRAQRRANKETRLKLGHHRKDGDHEWCAKVYCRTRKEGPIASRAAPSLQDSSFADAASRSRRSAFPSSSFARSSNVARSPPWIRVSASLQARRACPRRSSTCLNKLSFDFGWSTQVNAMGPRTLQSHPPPDSQARLPAVPIMRSDR